MTRSSTTKVFTPFKEPEREYQEYSEEEAAKIMAETMEQYMSKTRADYGSGVAKPKIEDKDNFKLKGQFLKKLRTNTFSSADHEDVNEHFEKVFEIVDLFHIPNITIDQVMLRSFPMSLTGAASRWLRNKPTSLITTWDGLKTKFLNKYCPPARTAKKIEEINNFQQEPDEYLYQAYERFKELFMKFPQHYLTEIQENYTLMYKTRQTMILFRSHLNGYYFEEKKGSYGPYFLEAYSESSHINNSIPKKEKDPGSFTLPLFINNVINRSLDPFFEDYMELNDLNEPFELRRSQGDDLMPIIEKGEVTEEFRTRDDEFNSGIDDYPS
nr:hypothetical protein [Tanacetum cinerariifolium]